jgi:hypothetical protein
MAPCATSVNSPASRIAAVASLELLAGAAWTKLISTGSSARPFGSGCRKIGHAHSPLFQRIGLKKSKFFIGYFIMSALLVGPIFAIHQNEVFRIGGCIFWRVNGDADDLLQVWKLQLRRAACDLKHAAPSRSVFSVIVAGIWMIDLQKHVATIRLTPEAGGIKTNEFRDVPVHEHLITLGFVEFVDQAEGARCFATWARTSRFQDPLMGSTAASARRSAASYPILMCSPTTLGATHSKPTAMRRA